LGGASRVGSPVSAAAPVGQPAGPPMLHVYGSSDIMPDYVGKITVGGYSPEKMHIGHKFSVGHHHSPSHTDSILSSPSHTALNLGSTSLVIDHAGGSVISGGGSGSPVGMLLDQYLSIQSVDHQQYPSHGSHGGGGGGGGGSHAHSLGGTSRTVSRSEATKQGSSRQGTADSAGKGYIPRSDSPGVHVSVPVLDFKDILGAEQSRSVDSSSAKLDAAIDSLGSLPILSDLQPSQVAAQPGLIAVEKSHVDLGSYASVSSAAQDVMLDTATDAARVALAEESVQQINDGKNSEESCIATQGDPISLFPISSGEIILPVKLQGNLEERKPPVVETEPSLRYPLEKQISTETLNSADGIQLQRPSSPNMTVVVKMEGSTLLLRPESSTGKFKYNDEEDHATDRSFGLDSLNENFSGSFIFVFNDPFLSEYLTVLFVPLQC
jgi:hypothetical protein